MDLKTFVKERDEALLSLDKKRITKFFRKAGIGYPDNDLVFWAGVHKAILHINSATEEQRDRSFTWLVEYGFNPTTFYPTPPGI